VVPSGTPKQGKLLPAPAFAGFPTSKTHRLREEDKGQINPLRRTGGVRIWRGDFCLRDGEGSSITELGLRC